MLFVILCSQAEYPIICMKLLSEHSYVLLHFRYRTFTGRLCLSLYFVSYLFSKPMKVQATQEERQKSTHAANNFLLLWPELLYVLFCRPAVEVREVD